MRRWAIRSPPVVDESGCGSTRFGRGGESLRRRAPFAVDVSVGVKFVPSAARDEYRGRGVAEPDEEHLIVLLHVVGDGLDRECLRRLAGCEGDRTGSCHVVL